MSYTENTVRQLLDRVVNAVSTATYLRITANGCQTRRDREKAAEAEEASLEVQDEVVRDLAKLIEEAK